MIKAIAFDLGGVLIREKGIELTGAADVIERKLGNINFDKEFYDWAVKETGLPLSKVKIILNDIMLNYYELREPDIFNKLPKLKFAIASNHLSGIRLWVDKWAGDTFHTIVISGECGYEKPKREFYQYLIKKLGEKAENILFIDDKIENILGAKKVGLQTLHFKRGGNLTKETLAYLKTHLVENYLQIIQEGITYSSDISLVYKIIDTFTEKERNKFMGPREWWDDCQYRKVLILDGVPIAYLEARIHEGRAKLNFGVNIKYRRKNYLTTIFKKAIIDLKKIRVSKLLAEVDKDNIKSNNLIKKMGFKEIIDPKKKKEWWGFINKESNYYELDL